MRSPCDLGAEEAQPESGRHRRRSPTRQGPRKAPQRQPAGPSLADQRGQKEACPEEESPDRHHSIEEERRKEPSGRESRTHHAGSHGLGAALRS